VTAGLDDLRGAFAELTEIHGCAPLQTPRSLLLALTGRVGAVASLVLVYLVALSDALGVDVVDDAVTRIRSAIERSSTPPDTEEKTA
jgi:hypothetical protein